MSQVGKLLLPELAPPLAMWHISSNTMQIREFREKLLSSSCHLGGKSPSTRMTPSARSGSAGVLTRVLILVQDL